VVRKATANHRCLVNTPTFLKKDTAVSLLFVNYLLVLLSVDLLLTMAQSEWVLSCYNQHTYTVGEQVMIEQHQQRKYGTQRFKGPYTVDRVYDNGTIRVRQDTANGGTVYQTWNIRNIHPYKA